MVVHVMNYDSLVQKNGCSHNEISISAVGNVPLSGAKLRCLLTIGAFIHFQKLPSSSISWSSPLSSLFFNQFRAKFLSPFSQMCQMYHLVVFEKGELFNPVHPLTRVIVSLCLPPSNHH